MALLKVLACAFDNLKDFCDDPPRTVGPDEREKIDKIARPDRASYAGESGVLARKFNGVDRIPARLATRCRRLSSSYNRHVLGHGSIEQRGFVGSGVDRLRMKDLPQLFRVTVVERVEIVGQDHRYFA